MYNPTSKSESESFGGEITEGFVVLFYLFDDWYVGRRSSCVCIFNKTCITKFSEKKNAQLTLFLKTQNFGEVLCLASYYVAISASFGSR
jgi:hypothetical protein